MLPGGCVLRLPMRDRAQDLYTHLSIAQAAGHRVATSPKGCAMICPVSLTGSLKSAVRGRLRGGLWQTPAFQTMMPALDRADALARRRRGLDDLPLYSMRIRSNGVEGQFGGLAFARLGEVVAESLEQYAQLNETSTVIDIGCGVGRVALALARRYPSLDYTGIDVDRVSIEGCEANPHIAGFNFAHIDVVTDLYNDGGTETADTYTLPFDSGTVDVVYLVSVFTHMLPDECRSYAREIFRVLRLGGRCAVTTHLLGADTTGWTEIDGAYTRFPLTPRKMLGHSRQQVVGFFGADPEVVVRGRWRDASDHVGPRHDFAQDMLIFAR